ncbi:hemin ABC transporter substrate-binding protein [Burkholderia sp. WAC0059]|uniref:heme/hemin ABC transporter substrate-binding protein n=1 Tax=Burkholderia sp. WAC0059 TaxID=2066022 RepID=UPI000C7E8A34|nr:ABC transporter substrate-binding protein [Burkholderia sp. WAC0059]PLZ03700.1 hemin ABC transporter substrate-binding protein [Burkholderia sp. WAC0059]
MTRRPFDAKRRAINRALATGVGALCVPRAMLFAATGSERVVVVGGALAEIVYRLGNASRLVATDTTCTYPPEAARLPKVGYQRALSAEGILSLRPDLLVSSAEAGPPSVLEQIRGAGVRVVTFGEGHDAASVEAKIRGVAKAFGETEKGRALHDAFVRDWRRTEQQVARAPLARRTGPLRVIFVLNQSGTQAMVSGEATAADAMIWFAGAANAMQGVRGYRPLSAEALVASAPDVILTTDDTLRAGHGAATLLASPGFAATPAGRAKRIVSMDTLFLLGFGPRLPDAVLQLHRRLRDA